MIRKIAPFRRWHLTWVEQYGEAEGGGLRFTETQRESLETHASYTLVVDGDPVGCFGAIQVWPGRHVAWSYLNKQSGPHMLFVTRAAKICLAKVQGRIEMTVRLDFQAGARWAEMLGFKVETQVLECYGPQGEDHVGYVRFN